MSKFHEPALADPKILKRGDQVACHDAGPRMQLITAGQADSEHGMDEIWVTLHNQPSETSHVYDEPVREGCVALHLGDQFGYGWRVGALPLVRARRKIAA